MGDPITYKDRKTDLTAVPRGEVTPSEPCQEDEAQENRRKNIEDYVKQLSPKLLDDFKRTFPQKRLDDFEKTCLQRNNSSDPICLEECKITLVATLVLKGVPQHVKEQYELRLTSGEVRIIKKLENVPLTHLSGDQSMTEDRTHTSPETSVHTANNTKEATPSSHTRDSPTVSPTAVSTTVGLSHLSLS
ncbi:uncharacterized protein LOC119349836 [Triticum dicoccoides]|nr:uncharacterized protein LOC119349836 [Triticum dicoccoides]XP_044425299.1 uncharacterized protein LOC123149657 [Triticum aestivum]